MDLQARIKDAQLNQDKTKGLYESAQDQTKQSKDDYESAFKNGQSFQSIYDEMKTKYGDSAEIEKMKSSWEAAKSQVDSTKTAIDKLPESISQQYGGTSLTQEQRDKAREQQMGELSKQFAQYDANYQVSFANYNDKVKQAFDTSLDVANKQYDSYWNKVRSKYDNWRTRIADEDKWAKIYSDTQKETAKIQTDYDTNEIKKRTMQQQKDFEIWRNSQSSIASKQDSERAMAQVQRDKDAAARKAKWDNTVADFYAGKITTSQFTSTKY